MHSAIYTGTVRHRRFSPHHHEFSYRIFLMYLDLDELAMIFRRRWLWSVGRPNLASFQRRNYLAPGELDLKEAVLRRVEQETGARPDGAVRVLTHMTYFGLCFNPISFYFVFNQPGDLAAIVADVSNTPWKERYAYVVSPKTPGMAVKWGKSKIMAEFEKLFHVSPFMPMDMRYRWIISNPGAAIAIQMDNLRQGQRDFDATMVLERRDISGANLARVLIFYPFMTAKVMGSIYGQALRLWIKRTPFFSHPGQEVAPIGGKISAPKDHT